MKGITVIGFNIKTVLMLLEDKSFNSLFLSFFVFLLFFFIFILFQESTAFAIIESFPYLFKS